jgi:formate-nitrite transporter family protein
MSGAALSRLAVPVTDRDHIRGPAGAPITLVEYGDFECPHCGRVHGLLELIEQQLGHTYRLVYRHFPMTQAHLHAEAAAEASEAAATQNLFWKMHDLLFANQDALDSPNLIRYGESLGIDGGWLSQVLTTGMFQGRVRDDFLGGVRSGVNGTPSFFIDGRRYDGPIDLFSMTAAIEDAAQLKVR